MWLIGGKRLKTYEFDVPSVECVRKKIKNNLDGEPDYVHVYGQ